MKRIWLSFFLLAANGAAAGEIFWLHSHLPPASIESGAARSQGYADKVEAVTRSGLTDFTHSTEWVPPARMNLMMKSGGPYCTSGMSYTEQRAGFMRFTPPIGWIHSYGVILRRTAFGRFAGFLDKEERIDLTRLAKADLRAGLILGRSYGHTSDRALKMVQTARRASEVNSFDTVLRMLQARRIDYTLGYLEELNYFAEQPNEYVFLPVKDTTALIPISCSCSRAPSADAAFAAILRVHDEYHIASIFQQEYERWLTPEYLPRYRKLLQEARPAY